MSDPNGISERQFSFCEEARDLLSDLEAALLQLENDPEDQETIGSVFRAMHTIKGSGAMFGFDAVANFTHNIESVYELVRSGGLLVSPALISLTLRARDHILHLLEATVSGAALDQATGNGILRDLEKVVGVSHPEAASPVARGSASPAISGAENVYSIRFVPPSDVFLRGTNLLPLFAELGSLGDLTVTADTAALPSLGALEPDRCYLAFTMQLRSTGSVNDIRDVFLFVDEGDSLTITMLAGVTAQGGPASPAAPTGAATATAAAKPVTSSLRVSANKLDELINIVGELVTMQARLSRFAVDSGEIEISYIAEETERLTNLLRDNTMSIRMIPIEATFARYRRLVRDLAAELGKEIELITEGGETELDKSLIDQIADPLVHIIRNSVDHGIESPADRRRAGKPSCGRLVLSAAHTGSQVLIRITDDGRGIDPGRVRAKAIEKGLIDPHAELTEAEVFALIFRTGFSTAATVSSVSGRGVGMDVVKRNVEAMRGTIELASTPGRGTVITLQLPLTLAIIDGLLVRVSSQHFVFPVAQVLECMEMNVADVHGRRRGFIEVRDKLVPLIFLHEFFQLSAESVTRSHILVAHTSLGHFGFVVDEVIGDHKTVIKQLGPLYRKVEGLAGSTILSDGGIALILDSDRLAQSATNEAVASAA
ncbi:MAG: chemotaxis protein CheA [Acidobacteriota bacterium]|jgi:two-component system chemotaxis sensor kinase CheA|nr:chemotaxis protein CheA [Bryobacteraceae bacterium CoA2 C42]